MCTSWTLRQVAQLAAFNFRSAGRTGCRHPEGAAAGAEAASTADPQGGGRGRQQRKRVGVRALCIYIYLSTYTSTFYICIALHAGRQCLEKRLGAGPWLQVRGLRGRHAGGGGGGEGLLIYIYIHISGLAHLPGLGATHVCASWTLRQVAQLAAFNFRSAGRTGCRHPEGAAAGAEAASTAAAQGGGRGRLQRKRVGVRALYIYIYLSTYTSTFYICIALHAGRQ